MRGTRDSIRGLARVRQIACRLVVPPGLQNEDILRLAECDECEDL